MTLYTPYIDAYPIMDAFIARSANLLSAYVCTPQTGHHITFDCPQHGRERTRLLAGKSTWEEVDTSNETRTGVNESDDGVMLFFTYLFAYLT